MFKLLKTISHTIKSLFRNRIDLSIPNKEFDLIINRFINNEATEVGYAGQQVIFKLDNKIYRIWICEDTYPYAYGYLYNPDADPTVDDNNKNLPIGIYHTTKVKLHDYIAYEKFSFTTATDDEVINNMNTFFKLSDELKNQA